MPQRFGQEQPPAHLWASDRSLREWVPLRGGFSGARIYRCHWADQSQTLLRAWPPGSCPERVAHVQQWITATRQAGCKLLPCFYPADNGSTIAHYSGRLWEMRDWIGGCPWAASVGQPPVHVALRCAANALGQFHAATSTLPGRRACAPAIVDRLRKAKQWTSQDVLNWSRFPAGCVDWMSQAASSLQLVWNRRGKELSTQLAEAATQTWDLRFCLRDVHLDNILFSGDRVTGLIDFDTLRVDTPAVDLARLVHSFAMQTNPRTTNLTEIQDWRRQIDQQYWPIALAGMASFCPLHDSEAELARVLADATAIFSLLNWLEWGRQRSDNGDRDPWLLPLAQQRIDDLCRFAVNYFL